MQPTPATTAGFGQRDGLEPSGDTGEHQDQTLRPSESSPADEAEKALFDTLREIARITVLHWEENLKDTWDEVRTAMREFVSDDEDFALVAPYTDQFFTELDPGGPDTIPPAEASKQKKWFAAKFGQAGAAALKCIPDSMGDAWVDPAPGDPAQSDRVYFSRDEVVAQHARDVEAIGFDQNMQEDAFSRLVQPTKELANSPFEIRGFADAAHPTRIWLPPDVATGQPVEAVAAEGVDRVEVPIDFSRRARYLSGEPVPVLSAVVLFRYITQRYVEHKTGKYVSVNGKILEMIRSFNVTVVPGTLFSAAVIDSAKLRFAVNMQAFANGSCRAMVRWKLDSSLLGGRRSALSGSFVISGSEGKISDSAGDTKLCF